MNKQEIIEALRVLSEDFLLAPYDSLAPGGKKYLVSRMNELLDMLEDAEEPPVPDDPLGVPGEEAD